MTVKTHTVWNMPIPETTLDAIRPVLFTMIQQGKTDGTHVTTYDSPIVGQDTIERTWVDIAAAEEWISCVTPYGIVSIEIISSE
jgi:hypothetical protein